MHLEIFDKWVMYGFLRDELDDDGRYHWYADLMLIAKDKSWW